MERLTKEEVIARLETVVEGLQKNIQLLKDGYRPCNKEWVACAEPFSECMFYLGNSHDDLIDMDTIKEENERG